MLNSSSFALNDILWLELEQGQQVQCVVTDYDRVQSKLILQNLQDLNAYYAIEAKLKTNKSSEKTKTFQTLKPYPKLSKEKQVNVSVVRKIEKFEVDLLGNLITIRQETRLPINHLKKS